MAAPPWVVCNDYKLVYLRLRKHHCNKTNFYGDLLMLSSTRPPSEFRVSMNLIQIQRLLKAKAPCQSPKRQSFEFWMLYTSCAICMLNWTRLFGQGSGVAPAWQGIPKYGGRNWGYLLCRRFTVQTIREQLPSNCPNWGDAQNSAKIEPPCGKTVADLEVRYSTCELEKNQIF